MKVTCEYKLESGACVPTRVHTVVISVQHSEDVTLDQLRADLMEKVVKAVIPAQYLDDKTVYHLQVLTVQLCYWASVACVMRVIVLRVLSRVYIHSHALSLIQRYRIAFNPRYSNIL